MRTALAAQADGQRRRYLAVVDGFSAPAGSDDLRYLALATVRVLSESGGSMSVSRHLWVAFTPAVYTACGGIPRRGDELTFSAVARSYVRTNGMADDLVDFSLVDLADVRLTRPRPRHASRRERRNRGGLVQERCGGGSSWW